MAECTYTAGYSMMAHLGKGKAIVAMYITASTADVITTPFARCVPVLTPAAGGDATSVLTVAESTGVVTITVAGTDYTTYQCLIMGDLY